MPDLYRASDVFLHLSVDESFGNVFLEAMATGLPVVAYESDRTRWIVTNQAFFADRTDPTSLPAQLATALQSKSAVEAVMRDRAKSFAWSSIAAQYESFFRKLCAR